MTMFPPDLNRRQVLRRTAANATLLAFPFLSARHALRVTKVKEANRFAKTEYREGWNL